MSCTSSMMRRTSRLWWCTMVCRTAMSRTCRGTLLPFLTRVVMWLCSIPTMPGADPSVKRVLWLQPWARCSRSDTGGMSTTKRRGCIISGVGITYLKSVVSPMVMYFYLHLGLWAPTLSVIVGILPSIILIQMVAKDMIPKRRWTMPLPALLHMVLRNTV